MQPLSNFQHKITLIRNIFIAGFQGLELRPFLLSYEDSTRSLYIFRTDKSGYKGENVCSVMKNIKRNSFHNTQCVYRLHLFLTKIYFIILLTILLYCFILLFYIILLYCFILLYIVNNFIILIFYYIVNNLNYERIPKMNINLLFFHLLSTDSYVEFKYCVFLLILIREYTSII